MSLPCSQAALVRSETRNEAGNSSARITLMHYHLKVRLLKTYQFPQSLDVTRDRRLYIGLWVLCLVNWEKKSLNFESTNKTKHLIHVIDWDEPGP